MEVEVEVEVEVGWDPSSNNAFNLSLSFCSLCPCRFHRAGIGIETASVMGTWL
jgi:hypothetical protein